MKQSKGFLFIIISCAKSMNLKSDGKEYVNATN